jgi:AcrR family transcriptional regulator
MARVRLTPDARRTEIAAAAARLFAEKGYAATSVGDIVRAVGIAQGTFYWHFASKEAVADAIVEAAADSQVAGLGAVVHDPSIGAVERFVRVRDAGFAAFAAERDALAVFHRPDNDAVHDRMTAAVRRRMVPLFAEFVADGVEEGVFTASDPEAAAVFVARAAEAVDADLLLDAPEDTAPRYAAALTEFVLRGLGFTGPLPPVERSRA